MKPSDLSFAKSNKSTWAMLIYFILCFYYFGVIMMTHFVDYPSLSNVHEHIVPVMQIFNKRMEMVCYIPSVLLVFSVITFYRFKPKFIANWAVIASAILTIISVVTTLFFISSIHHDFIEKGVTKSIQSSLLPLSLYFQIIPTALQVCIALVLLNNYLKDTKIIGRWLFIGVFFFSFYATGTGFVEMFVNYPHWSAIGEKDWLAHRPPAGKFVEIFLVPNFLPFLLTIPLFWWRPKGIPKSCLWIYWLSHVWIFVTTAVYFVPKIQLQLDHQFSTALIDDLIKYDLLLRFPAILILFYMAAKMFESIGKQKWGIS